MTCGVVINLIPLRFQQLKKLLCLGLINLRVIFKKKKKKDNGVLPI